MILIGITGKAGCGKDTVGEILAKEYNFIILSFARPIQQMVTSLLGEDLSRWADREWRETEIPIWNCSPRFMAQTLGTEWGRNQITPSIWLDLTLNKIISGMGKVAITDVRFRNEADVIRSPEWGGYIVHVHRAELDAPGATYNHASESGIGNPNTEDFHINNFGTREDLVAQVVQVVDRILELQQDALTQEEETLPDEEV